MSETCWYAVHTNPHQEDRVRTWIEVRRGLTVFLPKMEERRRRRARRIASIEPLFPSYLFVHMRLEPSSWQAVKWAPGVRRIVGTGDLPTAVPDDAIRLIKECCRADDVIEWRPTLRPGTAIRVVQGPFAGLEGILERPSARGERVRVLLNLLGTASPVEMDIGDIEYAQ
jgi:transcriptional antiterminator RfaH